MQLCGLVLEFGRAQRIPAATMNTLRSWPQCTLGEVLENRLPLVLETCDAQDAQLWHDRLAELDGVQQVHVAYVGFDVDSMSMIEDESEANYVI